MARNHDRRTSACSFLVSFLGLLALNTGPVLPATGGSDKIFKGKTTVIPAAEYEAGGLHRLLFGAHWRSLWTSPIEVGILDLERFAGGLQPIGKGGGRQTQVLRFRGNDGMTYKFRSMKKLAKKSLDPEFHDTFVEDIVQDQGSIRHPLSALIVAPLLNAVDVLNVEPILVVLPDDEILGEYRSEFAGLLGMIELHPEERTSDQPGFQSAERIANTYKMIAEIENDPSSRMDAAEFLKARLMDIFLGDWDRHADQWRWARYAQQDGVKLWKPIPRDRDEAFARYDGLFPWMVTLAVPRFNGIGHDYPAIDDLTWEGRFLDRMFLCGIEKEVWDSVANHVQSKLTDDVIQMAVKKMPVEYYAQGGEFLEGILRSRRDRLMQISDDFFHHVVKYTTVWGTHKAEIAECKRIDGRRLEVALYSQDASGGGREQDPHFSCTFDSENTREVRIFLQGGDDMVTISGEDVNPITIRVVGGDGMDTFSNNSARGSRVVFYDSDGDSRFNDAAGVTIDTKGFPMPASLQEKYEPVQQDFGHDWKFGPWLGFNSDDGAILGGGPILYEFGFRTSPYVYRMSLRGAFATTQPRVGLAFTGDFYSIISGVRILTDASVTQFVHSKFYGLGNESSRDRALDRGKYYRIHHTVSTLQAKIQLPLSDAANTSLGGFWKKVDLTADAGSFFSQNAFPGTSSFDYAGVLWEVSADSRDNTLSPLSGFYGAMNVVVHPVVLDNKNAFTKLKVDLRKYVPFSFAGLRSSMALRGSGEKIWGSFPLHEAAYLGGNAGLRGFNRERFAGDASISGTLELRTFLTKLKVGVPLGFGLSTFGESGRVFFSGENSRRWHTSYGGGLWVTLLDRMATLNVTVAASTESTRFYVGLGFMF